MSDRHSEPNRPREVDRRTLVRGTAWTVPAVAATVAAPAMAISGTKYTYTVSGVGRDGKYLPVTLPARAHDITFSISGGGGGSYVGPFDGMAGSGAMLAGTIDLNKCGADQTIWLVAGGGGDQPTVDGTSTQATGYGNGGKAYLMEQPAEVPLKAYQRSYGGGGGAGSAILVGGSSPAQGTPLVVAGGGGGDGVWGNSTSSIKNSIPVPVISPTTKTVGAGGTAPGGAGGDVTTGYKVGSLTATGGAGATASANGAGGSGSTTLARWSNSKPTPGNAGGGSGLFGGRNGGDCVSDKWEQKITYRTTSGDTTFTHWLGIASGAGGGGWTGGGSGGIYIVDNSELGPDGYTYRYAIAGAGGAGGAGSNYVASSAGCLAPTVTSRGSAGNAGSNSSGTGAGGPGTVTITYYV